MELNRVINLKGRVVSGDYGEGTKSERPAVFLETPDGKERFLLRRKGGPAYRDRVIENLVGKNVACDGFITGTTVLAEDIRVAE